MLDMKGCFCHFVKWQIHSLVCKEINYMDVTGNNINRIRTTFIIAISLFNIKLILKAKY